MAQAQVSASITGSHQIPLDEDTVRRARIRRAFDMFDKDGNSCVIQEEVSAIMRYLGAYPSEKDIIKKILPEMQDDGPSTFVVYEKFEKKMLEVLETNEYSPATDETLLAAFRAIDTEKRGYIDAEVLQDLLYKKGTPFREKEMEAFFQVAKDPQTGRIYYEDYIAVYLNCLNPKRK